MLGIEMVDIINRLINYYYHVPTVSFSVVGRLIIEPTQSESKEELDYLTEALIIIREDNDRIAKGKSDREKNILKKAPHTL